MNANNTTNFVKLKDQNLIISHKQNQFTEAYSELPAGIYQAKDIGGLFLRIIAFEPYKEVGDSLIKFKTGVVGDIIKKADYFFSSECERVYKQLGVTHKMGIVCHGPHGTGKTSTCKIIMMELAQKYNAVCLDMTGKEFSFIERCIEMVRSVQNNPIVVFVDEAERSISNEENEYLSYLDGTNSVDKSIFMGCTNYIERIPQRIRNRKSRIKHLVEITSLPAAVYEEYLLTKMPDIEKKAKEKFVYLAMDNGLTIDQFKHAIIDHVIEHVKIEDAVKASRIEI